MVFPPPHPHSCPFIKKGLSLPRSQTCGSVGHSCLPLARLPSGILLHLLPRSPRSLFLSLCLSLPSVRGITPRVCGRTKFIFHLRFLVSGVLGTRWSLQGAGSTVCLKGRQATCVCQPLLPRVQQSHPSSGDRSCFRLIL